MCKSVHRRIVLNSNPETIQVSSDRRVGTHIAVHSSIYSDVKGQIMVTWDKLGEWRQTFPESMYCMIPLVLSSKQAKLIYGDRGYSRDISVCDSRKVYLDLATQEDAFVELVELYT